ncbi:MAG: hypothetical protein IPH82_04355 [Chloroflexi bacterium]|nr:hypothetical protein [Chloroflexota bacterium]
MGLRPRQPSAKLGYYPIVCADGGRILSPDGKRFVLNQPEALSGLQKAADLRNVCGVTPQFGDVGQTATWNNSRMAGSHPDE